MVLDKDLDDQENVPLYGERTFLNPGSRVSVEAGIAQNPPLNGNNSQCSPVQLDPEAYQIYQDYTTNNFKL